MSFSGLPSLPLPCSPLVPLVLDVVLLLLVLWLSFVPSLLLVVCGFPSLLLPVPVA
jgi:hypothetical protein